MIKANDLRVGNKFLSSFNKVETVDSIIDNTDKGRIRVCDDCHENVPHYKSEKHRDMYSHLILCLENNNQYKPCEIYGIPLTEEWLKRFGFDEFQYGWYQIEKSPLKITWNIYDKNIRAFGYNLTNVCQYIHQLQNLYFALTGEELKEI